jgi:RND superfamily putative drug exporter
MQGNESTVKGIAARAGRWSAAHRKTTIAAWFAFVVLALFAGGSVGQKQLTDADEVAGEAGRAEHVIADAGLQGRSAESVLVQSSKYSVDDPQFQSAIADLSRRLGRVSDVTKIETPGHGDTPISKDRHAALVQYEIKGDPDTATDRVDSALAQIKATGKAHPKISVEPFGDATVDKAISQMFADDLQKAEKISLPLTLVILVVAFGALVAAGVPLLLAITAVIATMGLVNIASHVFPMTENLSSVVLLVGMAVGVDYSLFYLRREREERAAGHDQRTALQRAAATSGRAVLISGLTVMTAMAGMFFSGDKTFQSMGVGTMIVVAVAMIGSITVLPALLSWLGDRVEKGRLPFVARRRRARTESRLWSAVIDRALRHPVIAVVVTGGLLVALTIPAFGMKTKQSGPNDVPQDIPVVQTYHKIQKAFPGEENPAVVTIMAGDVRSPQVRRAIDDMRRQALATGEMFGPVETQVSKDGTVAIVDIPLAGDGEGSASKHALATLRNDVIPATTGKVADVNVTGGTAESVDGDEQLKSALPFVFAFVLALAFLLLLVTFRSIVIPIKAIVLNLLSVGAAYGVLVLVFQHGLGESLLGFQNPGAIVTWMPLFLFVILFGLSMDYHVFILSRVREAVDRGMSTEDAVAYGIKSTAGTVTSAAVVMVAVFGIFATLGAIDFKELGVGLATAILIDATVVRGVLLPATMKLLGEANWYLPKSLGWLPRVRHEPAVEPAQA